MNEALIEKVKQHQVLFDVTSPDYRNQNVRQEAWERIGTELGIYPETAKNGWDKLRRCYINALHRRRNKNNGQPIPKKTRWKYEKQMSFLLPFMEIYRKVNDKDENKGASTAASIEVTKIPIEIKKEVEVTPRPLHEGETPANKDQSIQTKVKQGGDERDADESDMFFMSMSKISKALPPLEQAKIKLAVSNAVLRAQLKFYERNGIGTTQTGIVDMECDVDFDPNQI